jgi:D-beta-D-heptose 7-phosphate kinase/D-beta-D-heptose 1-phosphate adenosyltransferase
MSGLVAIAGVEALVVGDVMLDEYVWGEARRISPEAPVPVVEVRSREHLPGGAANVAAGVVALECEAHLVGVVGDDDAAARLREAVQSKSIDPDGLIVDAARPTTTKTRVIANSQQVVRAASEARRPLPPQGDLELIERVRERLPAADALIISDYGKGTVTKTVARESIKAARDARIPIVIDSNGVHYSRYEGATVITPNVHEAGRAANVHIDTDEDLHLAATRLAEISGDAALLITRGSAGMTLYSEAEPFHVPTRAQEVFDVTGAGDTVVAALAVALGGGMTLRDAVQLANAAAGIVVGKVGTAAVSLAELEAGFS